MDPNRFQFSLAFVLSWEGGYSNDPQDHGGATNLGIIQTEYDRYRNGKHEPRRSVRYITRDEAADIYRWNYWVPMGCAGISAPMDVVLFDTAVNLGLGECRTILSRHPGGPGSTSQKRAADFLTDRDRVYRQIALHPGQSKFLAGWLHRDNALRKAIGL